MHESVTRRLGGGLSALVLIIGSGVSGLAQAIDFPVTGTVTVNGAPGELPSGGTFANSSYAPTSGLIGAGTFTFPITTETTVSDGITFVLKYQMIQTDTSNGAVAPDGVAALSAATFKLKVISITASGFPLPIGVCEIQPIAVDLAGTASAIGLNLSDAQFDIPQVPVGQCGSFRDSFNDAFFGGNNSMTIQLTGDFTPPSTGDLIFRNGFENP